DLTLYKTRVSPGTPGFTAIAGVPLVDQLENATVTVLRPKSLGTPSNKNAEGVIDPSTRVMAYTIKNQVPKHIKRTAIRGTNQLGELHVNTKKPDLLLVPSGKNLLTTP